jgi:glycerol-1-phosphate dehydrogenase [NAD(P)+]
LRFISNSAGDRNPEAIFVADDAIERLAAYARERRWKSALLVMDANTEAAAGSRVRDELTAAGVRCHPLRFPQRSGLKADPDGVAAVRARLRDDRADGLAAVGSGVITDLTRYAAHVEDRDFVSVPTAASMDGYASSVAAMERDGVKLTFPARAPLAIFADPRVLAAAPGELTRAGLGDLLGKATARVDWLASHLLFGEPYSEEVAGRVAGRVRIAAERTAAILRHEPEAIRGLAAGLIESGLAMSTVGSSRPASGCEHHASHFWDLLAARGRRRPAPHGIQVGCATHFAIRLQRFAYGGGVPAPAPPRPDEPFTAEARSWLGEPTPEIVAAVEEKRRFVDRGAVRWPADNAGWATIRARLAPAMEPFEAVERALTAAAIPADPGFIDVDAETLRATFRYANRLRARYTVLDFLEGQGALAEALDVALATATSGRARARG